MSGKVWFVTGASKGLGLVLARRLLAEGQRVAVTSRTLRELVAALGEKSASLLPLEVDLLDEGSVAAAVQSTLAHFGDLDVVVNNAGYGQFGTVEEVSDVEARKNYDVNVFGTLNVLRATLPHLRGKRAGHVFNIASIGGFVGGFSGWGIYCSTKFAVAGLTEGLHADLADVGVHVTLVYPGYFRTDFLAQGSVALPAREIADYAAARESQATHTTAINHNQPGDPEKLARALIETARASAPPLHLFLGSDAFASAQNKLKTVRAELERYESMSVSTDFDGAAQGH